jgi:hypothetical protein
MNAAMQNPVVAPGIEPFVTRDPVAALHRQRK